MYLNVFDELAWWVLPLNQLNALYHTLRLLESLRLFRLVGVSPCIALLLSCTTQAMVVGIPRFIFISPDGNLLEDCEEVAQRQKDSYKRLLCVRCWVAVMWV